MLAKDQNHLNDNNNSETFTFHISLLAIVRNNNIAISHHLIHLFVSAVMTNKRQYLA